MSNLVFEQVELIDDMLKKNEVCANILKYGKSGVQVQAAVSYINDVRASMKQIDETLSDVTSVLLGYAQAVIQQEEKAADVLNKDAQPSEPTGNISNANEGRFSKNPTVF